MRATCAPPASCASASAAPAPDRAMMMGRQAGHTLCCGARPTLKRTHHGRSIYCPVSCSTGAHTPVTHRTWVRGMCRNYSVHGGPAAVGMRDGPCDAMRAGPASALCQPRGKLPLCCWTAAAGSSQHALNAALLQPHAPAPCPRSRHRCCGAPCALCCCLRTAAA